MIQFASPMYFIFGLMAAVVIVWAFIKYNHWRKRTLLNINPDFYGNIFTKIPNHKPKYAPLLFKITIVICMAMALSNPQWGSATTKQRRTGSEVIFVIDVSNSMAATDQLPTRLDFAKKIVAQYAQTAQTNRIGIVIYAQEAQALLPITADIDGILLQTNEIATTLIPTQGSYSSRAIDLAAEMFDKQQRNLRNKAVFLLSDGEDMQGNPIEAAASAAAKNISVCTIGIGTTQGSKITIDNTPNSAQTAKIITTKANPDRLQQIAASGKGSYIQATNASTAVGFIEKNMDNLQKNSFETTTTTQKKVRFQVFLGVVLLLIIFMEIFF